VRRVWFVGFRFVGCRSDFDTNSKSTGDATKHDALFVRYACTHAL